MDKNFIYDLEEIQNNRDKNMVMDPALAYRHDAGEKTLADYLALPEGTRVEMIEGTFYDMAAPTMAHQSIALEICSAFRDHIRKNGGTCTPFIAPADVQLFGDDRTMVQPDVFVVCDRERIHRDRLVGSPDLVVEVASPGNWRVDGILKRQKYMESGVREYWIVFPEDRKIWVYLFEKHGGHICPEPIEYTFADKVPVGIWGGECEVDFAEIYEAVYFLYGEV